MREKSSRPDRKYAAIPNSAMRDTRLSAEARGVLAYLMTFSDEWHFRREKVMDDMGLGRDRFQRVMGELREHGYVELVVMRDEKGALLGTEWVIRDDPTESLKTRSSEATESLKTRQTAEPTAGKPAPIRIPKEKEDQREEETQTLFGFEDQKREPKPKADQAEAFSRFWAIYPKKVGKPAALKNWQKAIKNGADPEVIIAAARVYAGTDQVQRGFVKHPQGWLTEERWNDPDLKPQPQAPAGETLAQRRERLLSRGWHGEVTR